MTLQQFLGSGQIRMPFTEPYSMTQDSTLDTPQGGALDNFFLPLTVGVGNTKNA